MSQAQTILDPMARTRRREALGPFLALVEAGGPNGAPPAATNRIAVDERFIELSHWEWTVLAKGLRLHDRAEDAEPRIEDWPRRVAEGVAFQARYLTHVARLQSDLPPAPAELEVFRAELLLDAALGLALQEELQRDVNNLVASGELDEAKKLTGFRHKLGQSLGRLKEIVGEQSFRGAEARAVELAAPAPVQSKLPAVFDTGEAEEVPRPFKRDVAYTPVQHVRFSERNLIRPLLIVLAVSAVACAATWIGTRRGGSPPPIPLARFDSVEGVESVNVRSPSLYVTVETGRWAALGRDGRLALVEQVGAIAAQNRYRGAVFRTGEGTTVAQWLASGGARLVEARPGPRS